VKHQLLNNIEHRNLRVDSKPALTYGENSHFAMIVPAEIVTAKNFYPLFIYKDGSTGQFFFSAIFGFQEGENLFLDEKGWNSEYIPLSIARKPFLIGQQESIERGQKIVKRVINIDMESPRVNSANGERVFTDSGESTTYLDNIATILEMLHHGLAESEQLINKLLGYDLLEPMSLKLVFNEHRKYELNHLYTIKTDALNALDDDKVLALFRDGSMEKIYALMHSQARISTLIRLKNERDAL
jgi:SapC